MGTMTDIVNEPKLNLMQKIVAIMNEVQRLQKDDNVSFGKTSYKALSEEKVTSIMHEKMVKYNLVVFPVEQEWSREGTITHVNVKYRIVDAENTADWIEVVSCGDGADTQDKGSGKAMTYAFKYMWLRTFAIPTGEDPDKIASAELDAKEQTISTKEAAVLGKILNEKQTAQWLEHFGKDSLEKLGKDEYAEVNEWIRKAQEKKKKEAK